MRVIRTNLFSAYTSGSNSINADSTKFFNIICDETCTEFPSFLLYRKNNSGLSTVCAVQEHANPVFVNTFTQFYKKLDNSQCNNVLYKISYKGTIYYVNKGLILDSNFNILLLCTLKGPKEDFFNNCTACVYIHPSIIVYSSLLLNKNIIKNLLPRIVSSSTIYIPSNYRLIERPLEISIKDVTSKFILPNISPKSYNTLDEDINKLLIDNVELITQQL